MIFQLFCTQGFISSVNYKKSPTRWSKNVYFCRKAEERVLELLLEEGVKKADFHCFCGKANLGLRIAEAGYYLSIPTAIENSSNFQVVW